MPKEYVIKWYGEILWPDRMIHSSSLCRPVPNNNIKILNDAMLSWFFIFVISTFNYFEILLRALIEVELLLEYIMRSVLIIFLFVLKKMPPINNVIRINEICGRNITYTFNVIDSFNPWEISESVSIKHNTVVDLFYFSRSRRKDSAVHGRWKPKRWNERRRHARRRNRYVSDILYAWKQQEVICRSFNPKRLSTISFCDSEFIPEEISVYACMDQS